MEKSAPTPPAVHESSRKKNHHEDKQGAKNLLMERDQRERELLAQDRVEDGADDRSNYGSQAADEGNHDRVEAPDGVERIARIVADLVVREGASGQTGE